MTVPLSQQAKDALRHDTISVYMKSAKRDQMNMIKRKEMIEHRKEYYENLNTEKERAELQEREKTRREAEKAETKRRDEEEKRRTEERSAREEKHKDKLLKMEKVKKLMEQVCEFVIRPISMNLAELKLATTCSMLNV